MVGGFKTIPWSPLCPRKRTNDWSVGDIFKGAVETAGTMITGMTTGLVGRVTGAVDGYVGGLMAGMKPELMSSTGTSGLGRMRFRLRVHTYPRLRLERTMVEAVGGAMAPLEVMEPFMPALGMPAEAAAAAGTASRQCARLVMLSIPTLAIAPSTSRTAWPLTVARVILTTGLSPDYQPNGAMYPGQTADPAGQALQVTGGKFMAPEHVSMVKNADPVQRGKMARMREESIASKNGTKAEHSPYNVIADEFEARSRVLGQVGEQYLSI